MKKIFFCFLITITALGLMSSFSFAYAQTLPDSRTLISSTPPGGDSAVEHSDGTGGQEQPPSTNSVGLKCGAGFGTGNPIDCLTLAIAWVGALFIWIIGWIFSIASSFFEMMLRVSIEYFDQYANLQGVKTAWITGRNLANIFFIFILLWIGIKTILGIEGSNTRKMLTTVIVCALLINFSFTITREIIGLTNGAAQAFYSALDMNNSKNNLNYRLKAAFFEPAEKAGGQTAVSDVTAHSLERIPGNSLSEIAVNGFGIIAILLIASFVFIAAGVLFLYRTVSLLFALVLSPLAFVAPVVPKFENRSSQYWNWLIQQSLFAPAVMFCFILVYAIAAPGSVTLPQGALTIAGFDLIKSAAIISFIKFILIAGTLLGSLLVAKAMGAAGVGVANKIAHGTMNYLGAGSAGLARVAGGQKAIDFARRKAGQAGEAIQTSDSIAAKALRFMPGGKRVGAALGAQARGQVADYEKSLANLSSNALKRRMSMGTISALEKAAITNVLAGRGDLKPGTGLKEGMVTGGAIPTLQQISGDAKKIEKLDWQYATNPTERAGAVPNIKPENIEKLKANEYFDGAASSQNVRQAMYSGFHGGHMDSIISHPDPNVNRQFFANLRNDLVRTVNPNTGTPFKNSVSDLVTYLTDARIGIKGNRLAGWAQSQVGENMLKANGFS